MFERWIGLILICSGELKLHEFEMRGLRWRHDVRHENWRLKNFWRTEIKKLADKKCGKFFLDFSSDSKISENRKRNFSDACYRR